MGLCKNCMDKWDKYAMLPEDSKENYPYLHCHHEEEEKAGCPTCFGSPGTPNPSAGENYDPQS